MSNANTRVDLEGIIFPNRDVARTLRSTCRDLAEVVRVLDAKRQSDMAGRLHTLTIELRQLASIADLRADDQSLVQGSDRPAHNAGFAVAH
jgi:hypothetical protein